MTESEFRLFQQEDLRSVLSALLQGCVGRFLAAGNLIELDGPVFEAHHKARYGRYVSLEPLCGVWEIICERYMREQFDPQSSVFKDHRTELLEKWVQLLHWKLFPHLLRENEFVRNVLRATGLLPCRSREGVEEALASHVREMALPFNPPALEAWEIE